MQIDVNGVKITLTPGQLKEIDAQVKKQKPIEERIFCIEDIYSELGIKRILPYKNPKTKEEKSANALIDIFNIVKCYNGGAVLDWKNTSQYKWAPYKYFSGGCWVVTFDVWHASLLSPGGSYYKEKKLAEAAFKNFESIYNDFWMI